MSILATVSSLLRAVAAYWELRAARYEHDLREQSRARVEALEDELEELRNCGTVGGTLAADRLRNRLLTEKAYFEHLPGSRASSGSGGESPDKGRGL